MIDLIDVSFQYENGTEALHNVNLRVNQGEFAFVVGSSGAGKTSILKLLLREAVATSGQVIVNGFNLNKLKNRQIPKFRRSIGVVFQDPIGSLSPLHRIGEQLVETLLLHSDISRAAARAMALEWLEKVGIPEPLQRFKAYPHELSGGMQQRVMIAMALILGPDLIIADEPTTALDVTVQAQILDLMRSLVGKSSALLLITQDLGVVARMATKLAVMKDGKVIEKSEDVIAFFTEPKHPHSRALVAEARKMELH